MNGLLIVLGVAAMFLLLIAPHEAGHFALAKLFRVRVLEFSIGAGSRLWSVTRGGTLYAIRAIPIIGYVRMGGMESDFDDPSGFHRKPAWQRIIILAAGPAANFLMAILLVTGLELTQLNTDPGKVLNVVQGSPAAAAGFQTGDSVKSVNGKALTNPRLIRQEEDASPGQPLVITGVHPDGKSFTATVTPKCDAQLKQCQIGVGMPPRLISWRTAVNDGISFPFVAIANIVTGLGQLVTGEVPGGLLGPNGFTGPIGIADVAAQSVSLGPGTYIFFVALLSVALGFTNLLPFLALDGGRVAVVLLEVLRRKPFDRAAELNFQRVGLAALLALAAVISVLDIQRIATGQFPGLR
jgi:regulator of sigma E protease